MDLIRTSCPGCGKNLEFPTGIAHVICANCGVSYLVHQYEGTLGLLVVQPVAGESQAIDEELLEVNNHIADVTAELEAVRSKEQGIPLEKGCGLFGIFFLVVLVMAFFMTLGIDYFGKWPFYVSMVVVLALGLIRMRRKLATPDEINSLRSARARLEDDLRTLNVELARLQSLEQPLTSYSEPYLYNNED